MFETFDKENAKRAHLWRVATCFILPIWLGGLGIICYFGWFDEPSDEKLLATAAERDRRAEALCDSLPNPENFKLVSKNFASAKESARPVIYVYESERDFEEIMPLFAIWLDTNGWQSTPPRNFTFEKTDQIVEIRRPVAFTDGSYRYEIYCEAYPYEINN